MNVLVTIFNVTTLPNSNPAIGLDGGNLYLAHEAYTDTKVYKTGIIDRTAINGLVQSCSNITAGGTFSEGYTGNIKVTLTSAGLVALLRTENIYFANRTCRISFVNSAGVRHDECTFPISSFEVSDELSIILTLNTSTIADRRFLQPVVVTKEMALNSTKIVDELIVQVEGNAPAYKLLYCEVPDTMAVSAGDSQDIAGVDVFNMSAQPIQNDYTVAEVMTPDLSFARGKSILICIGAWQPAAEDYVWVAFSYNGYLPLGEKTRCEFYIQAIKNALVGLTVECRHGTGRGNQYKIRDVAWATHPLAEWEDVPGTTDLEQLWFQLDTTKKSDIQYARWAYMPYYPLDGVSPLAFDHVTFPGGTEGYIAFRQFAETRKDDKPLNNVSHFCFKPVYSGVFLTSAAAPSTNTTILEERNDDLVPIATLPSVDELYSTDKWKMISLPMNASGEAATFDITENIPTTSYLLDVDGEYSNYVLNGMYYKHSPEMDGDKVQTAGIFTNRLTNVPPGGIVTDDVRTTRENVDMGQYGSDYGPNFMFNTYYIICPPEVFRDGCALSLMPDIEFSWIQRYRGQATTLLDRELRIEVIAIGQGNTVLTRKSHSVKLPYSTGATNVTNNCYIRVNTELERIEASDECTAFDNIAPNLYRTFRDALSFSESDLENIAGLLNGFVVYVKYDRNYGSVIPVIDHDIDYFTKCIRPLRVGFSRSVAKDKLYIRAKEGTYVATYTSPVDIAVNAANLCGVNADISVGEVSAMVASRLTKTYNGSIKVDSDTTLGSYLDELGAATQVAFYLTGNGELKAVDLMSTPTGYSRDITNTLIEDGSAGFSSPYCGYTYGDITFKVMTGSSTRTKNVQLDINPETFPADEDYAVGDITYSASNGFAINLIHNGYLPEERIISVRISSLSRILQVAFVPGTRWLLKINVTVQGVLLAYSIVMVVDTVSPDVETSVGYYGIRLVGRILDVEIAHNTTIPTTLTALSSTPSWTNLVSSPILTNYTRAKYMWETVKNARNKYGSSATAPSSVTTLKSPIYGDDIEAILNWMQNSVNYLTSRKLLFRFQVPMTDELFNLSYMEFIRVTYGPANTIPMTGYVIELTKDVANLKMSVTLLVVEGVEATSALITENSIPVATEGGPSILTENLDGMKISELTLMDPEDIAGASIPVAIGGANGRVTLQSLKEWIRENNEAVLIQQTAAASTWGPFLNPFNRPATITIIDNNGVICLAQVNQQAPWANFSVSFGVPVSGFLVVN